MQSDKPPTRYLRGGRCEKYPHIPQYVFFVKNFQGVRLHVVSCADIEYNIFVYRPHTYHLYNNI